MKEFLVYTAMRLLLFAATFAVIFGAWYAISEDTTNVLVVFVIAFVISGIASYSLLHRQREALAAKVESRAQRASAKLEEMRRGTGTRGSPRMASSSSGGPENCGCRSYWWPSAPSEL